MDASCHAHQFQAFDGVVYVARRRFDRQGDDHRAVLAGYGVGNPAASRDAGVFGDFPLAETGQMILKNLSFIEIGPIPTRSERPLWAKSGHSL